MKKTILTVALLAATGVASAAPVAVTSTFDMYDITGALVNQDATVTGSFDYDAGTWAVASDELFFGATWTAYGGALYGEGTHIVSTDDSGVGGEAGPDMTFTVGEGQTGGVIKFAWGTSFGIDVIQLWDNATGDSLDVLATQPTIECALPFPGAPAEVCSVTSVDTETSLDGILGQKMVDGPFIGFSANFDIDGGIPGAPSAVPVPAAVWLFGSGLLGLVGVARRKKVSV